MMRLAVNQFCSYRWSFFHDVIQYAKHGFNSIGIWRKKLEEFGLDQSLDLLCEMQIDVSSLHWAGGFTGSNGNSFIEAIDDAKTAIQQSHRLQAGCLLIHPGARNGHTNNHLRRLLTDALNELVPFAEDYGVRLALEPCLGQANSQWNFYGCLAEQLEFIHDYPAKNLGLVLDLYHVGEQECILEHLESLKSRIALVQLADYRHRMNFEENRCSLGSGKVPIKAWLNELNAIEYEGYLELELHGYDLELTTYETVLQESRHYLSTLPLEKRLVIS